MTTEADLQKVLSGEKSIDQVMPKVSVATPDGKPTSIDDYDSFMSFLMQASQLAQLTKIRKYFDDRTSHGLIQRYDFVATDQIIELRLDYPAQSASIKKDGVNDVLVWVNTTLRPPHRMVRNGETFDIAVETHKLNCFYFQCNPGQTVPVRVVAND